MKTKKLVWKLSVTILSVMFILPVYAKTNSKAKLVSIEKASILAGDVAVLVSDPKGNNYNLNDALTNDGTYYLTQLAGENIEQKEFFVRNSVVLYVNDIETYNCAPVFKESERGIAIYYQCPTNESINVSFESDFERFFNHKTRRASLAHKYITNDLPSGSYNVEVSIGSNSYTYNFEVK